MEHVFDMRGPVMKAEFASVFKNKKDLFCQEVVTAKESENELIKRAKDSYSALERNRKELQADIEACMKKK